MLRLYIANKNYSSWSMRAWLVMEAFNIPYSETLIPYDKEGNIGQFKKAVLTVNPNGKVPILLHDDFMVWDSLAISEYLADLFPQKKLWPEDIQQRAKARSITAEMHSSFLNLRNLCPMDICADLSDLGKQLWSEHEILRIEVQRIEKIWADRPDENRFLCGDFSIADAFYAPVIMRLRTYGLPVHENAQKYMQTMFNHSAIQSWVQGALQEKNNND